MNDVKTAKYYWETITTEASDSLNEWEMRFISDIEMRVRNNQPLTDKQFDKLQQIYDEKTK